MEQNLFGKNESVFYADLVKADYPKLNQDIHVDLAIIGGSTAGITLAYLLKHSGQKIAIFEQNQIAEQAARRGISQLTLLEQPIYHQLTHSKSPGKAKKYADASRKAAQFIRETIKNEHICCDFADLPFYIYSGEKNRRKIESEIEACKRLEIRLEREEALPINLPYQAAVKCSEAALFNVPKYLLKLAEDFIAAGGKIYENTKITAVKKREALKGEKLIKGDEKRLNSLKTKEEVILETEEGVLIYAQDVVFTTMIQIEEKAELYFPAVTTKHNSHIAIAVKPSQLPRGSFRAIEPSGYTVTPIYEKKMVVISKRHQEETDKPNDMLPYEELLEYAKRIFDTNEAAYYWSDETKATFDRLPYIGFMSSTFYKPVYLAIGFDEAGIIGETAAALMLKDMLLIGRSEWEELFNPKRVESLNIY